MTVCPKCNSYRVEARVRLIDPKTGKRQFRVTDLSVPILLVFVGTILYAAIDSLFSPSRVDKTFGLVFLLLFIATVLSLLYSYLTRDRFIEMLQYKCMDCKNYWNESIPGHTKSTAHEH